MPYRLVVKQFSDIPLSVEGVSGYDATLISKADDKFYEVLGNTVSGTISLDVHYTTDVEDKYDYPEFSLMIGHGGSEELKDEKGNVIPYYWRIGKPISEEKCKVSIGGKELNFGESSVDINEVIAILGEHHEYKEEDLSSKQAIYTWKYEDYTYKFNVNIEDEGDSEYNKVKSIIILVTGY